MISFNVKTRRKGEFLLLDNLGNNNLNTNVSKMHCARKRIVILLYLLPQNVRCTFLKVEIAANILNFALGREYNFIATFAFSPLYILYQNPRIKFKPPPTSFPIEVTCNAIIPLLQFSRRY